MAERRSRLDIILVLRNYLRTKKIRGSSVPARRQNGASGTSIAFTHVRTQIKQQQGRESNEPTECPIGLGGFPAWPAQARAFSKTDQGGPEREAIQPRIAARR